MFLCEFVGCCLVEIVLGGVVCGFIPCKEVVVETSLSSITAETIIDDGNVILRPALSRVTVICKQSWCLRIFESAGKVVTSHATPRNKDSSFDLGTNLVHHHLPPGECLDTFQSLPYHALDIRSRKILRRANLFDATETRSSLDSNTNLEV